MQDGSCVGLFSRAGGRVIGSPHRTPLGPFPWLEDYLPLLTKSRPLTVSFPRMFSASQTYSPASSNFTLLNWSREFFLVREGTRWGECELPGGHPVVTSPSMASVYAGGWEVGSRRPASAGVWVECTVSGAGGRPACSGETRILSLWILASIPFPELDLLCNHFSRAGNWHPLGSHKDFSTLLPSPPCLPDPLPAEQPLTHSHFSLPLEVAAPPLWIDKACPRYPGRPMLHQVSRATAPSLPVLTCGSPLP